MDCSPPGFPVHHQLPEPTQTHVQHVGDAIQPYHPLSSPFPCLQSFLASGSFPMSRFFASGGQSNGVSALASVSSVQFSHSVVSDSLRPHELQHARAPCLWPTPRVHSNSRLSSWWCHPAISSSVVPLSSCPQSLPASESFPMSQVFAWSSQSTGVSALASFLPKNTQGWSPL